MLISAAVKKAPDLVSLQPNSLIYDKGILQCACTGK